MSKRIIAALVAAVVAVAVGWWWRDRSRSSSTPAPASAAPTHPAAGRANDPRTQAEASIAGTVTALDGGPITGAQVCATWASADRDGDRDGDGDGDPRCATTDATGRYRLGQLVPTRLQVTASAATYQPTAWRPAGSDDDGVALAPGQDRTGLDFTLLPGGVELRGTVEDVSGGPVGGAVVSLRVQRGWRSHTVATTRADATGAFVAWAKPGTVFVAAAAAGYTDGGAPAVAPSSTVRVLLTPASSLAGVVLAAADRRPIAGASVSTSGGTEGTWTSTRTDDQGRFRLTRLGPGRYKPTASGDAVFGMPVESILVGLGQQVEDVEILVGPAFRISGTVVIEGVDAPCPDARVRVTDPLGRANLAGTTDAAGAVTLASVLPGHYEVTVACGGHASQDHYPDLDVVDADISGLTWTVTAGARLHGTVTSTSGAPVADALVFVAGAVVSGSNPFVGTPTRADGTFEVAGLRPGPHMVRVMSDAGRAPAQVQTVDVPADGDATVTVVLEATGEIAGTVVDTDGMPVRGVDVRAATTGRVMKGGRGAITGDDGGFLLTGVEPGAHRVTAERGRGDQLRWPGSTDDDRQGEVVTVVADQRATVRLVVESSSGTIAGVVLDARAQPVADAWISASREASAAGAPAPRVARSGPGGWSDGRPPVVTGLDGRFQLDQLTPGTYSVLAYRKGGGEATAAHVAVGARDARLVIATAGSIDGMVTVTGGRLPASLTLTLTDAETGFEREEDFFRTDGAFALRDLPPGAFTLTATGNGAHGKTTVVLAAGEHKHHVAIQILVNTTVSGRFVDLETGAPVARIRASLSPGEGADEVAALFARHASDGSDVSGDDGRWRVADVAPTLNYVSGEPLNADGPWTCPSWLVDVHASTDLGDVPVVKRRVQAGEAPGTLGMAFVQAPRDADPRTYVMRVSRAAPGLPAAKAGIQADDVVVAIDGHDVRGARSSLAAALLEVAPGTAVEVTLEPDRIVTLVAVPDR